jgi:hypothetical protein
MSKPYVPLVLLFLLAGCQSASPRVQISPEHARSLNLALSGGLAPGRAGALFLTTPSTLMGYEPRAHRLEDLLNEPCRDLKDVAVTPDGIVLVLRPRSLSAFLAGYLIKLHDLPGEAMALSCDREFAYVLSATERGTQLLRIGLTGPAKGVVQPLLLTEERPSALCAVRGGCLVASGGNVVKVTDPVPDEVQTGQEVTTALLVSVQEPITALVADQQKLIVYFATRNMTYAWLQGQIVPLFPAGSRLALSGDCLTICLPAGPASQLVQIPAASQQAQRLLKALNKNAKQGSA